MGSNCMNPLNMWIFWIYSRPFVSALLYPWIQPTLDQDSIFDPWLGIHRWEFSDAEGQLRVVFYAVICKGLEHICMLVSVKGPEKQPPVDTEGWVWLCFGGVKSYTQIFNCTKVGALISVLFKGHLYFQERSFTVFEKGVVTAWWNESNSFFLSFLFSGRNWEVMLSCSETTNPD